MKVIFRSGRADTASIIRAGVCRWDVVKQYEHCLSTEQIQYLIGVLKRFRRPVEDALEVKVYASTRTEGLHPHHVVQLRLNNGGGRVLTFRSPPFYVSR